MKSVVGNTKLELLKDFESFNNEIFVKDESVNPSGSIKDRTVTGMLEHYRDAGKLIPNCTIIEATSGNTGISLAFFQKEYNYNAIIVLPRNASLKRREIILSYSAKIVLVDGGMKECNEKAFELFNSIPNSFIFDQFNCDYNFESQKSTGREILNDLNDVDYIFAGIGTAGTITGIKSVFLTRKTKVIGVEPSESPLFTKGYSNLHKIEGIGANFVPPLINKCKPDEIVSVSFVEASEMIKKISPKYFVGISSGACLAAAIKYIKLNKLTNKKIVVIFPDKGDRYIW